MTRVHSGCRVLLVGLLVAIGGWQLGHAAYIQAKAVLAQLLLERAWVLAQRGDEQPKPWSWADTWPLARLRVERLDVDQIVLAGASGRTLAFGPGHLTASALPGAPGNTVLSGHRDTHFRFLRHLRQGDRIQLEQPDGRSRLYRVAAAFVRSQDQLSLLGETSDDRLTLVTCYPFDALVPGGPLRFIVVADAEPGDQSGSTFLASGRQ